MSQAATLEVRRRPETGKGSARKAREAGLIPAICYGRGVEPVPLAVDPKALGRALDPRRKRNTLLTLRLAGEARELTALLCDVQIDSLRGDPIHADFLAVRPDAEVRVVVPVELVGRPEGVKKGGLLHTAMREIEVACRADRIPEKLTVNVEALDLGQAVHISDLRFEEGVRPLRAAGTAVASVVAPREEKTEAAAAAETAEAAEAAAAAPAEGAAAPSPEDAREAAKAAARAAAKAAAAAGDEE